MNWFGINNAVTWFISNVQWWQAQMKEEKSKENFDQRNNNSKAAFQNSLNATDEELKNNYSSMCNNELLANSIVLAAQSHGSHDYDDLDTAWIINRFLSKNPNKGYDKYVNDCSSWKITLWEAVSRMKLDRLGTAETNKESWLSHRSNPLNVDTSKYVSNSTATRTGITAASILGGLWLGAWVAESVYYGSKLGSKLWKWWLEMIYKPTNEQKSYKQYLDANEIQAKDNLKTAKNNLKKSEDDLKAYEKKWNVPQEISDAVEKAKEDVKKAEESVSKAKDAKKKLRTVADTAYDYGIWDIRNGSIFNDKWWAVARARANEIFDDVLNPIFVADDATTINVMDRVEELRDKIPNLTKDPWKQEDLMDAWAALLDEFRGKWYDKYPLKDVQKLKSDLQKDIPEKLWNGKNISSAYKTLKAELSRDIRKDLVAELDKALKSWKMPNLEWTRYAWKDAATLYRDWANLDEIADRALKYETPWVNVPGLWRLEWDISWPTQKTLATWVKKISDTVNESKFSKIMSKINKTVGKWLKNSKVLKVLGWLWTVLWPIWFVSDAHELVSQSEASKWYWDLMRIYSRYNKILEFEWKTDKEIEEMFPESEVIEILTSINNDDGFNDWYNLYWEDLFWREKIDIDKYWDYVWWRLKNSELESPELKAWEAIYNKDKSNK